MPDTHTHRWYSMTWTKALWDFLSAATEAHGSPVTEGHWSALSIEQESLFRRELFRIVSEHTLCFMGLVVLKSPLHGCNLSGISPRLRLLLGSATGCDPDACTPGRSCGTSTCPACTKSWAASCSAAAWGNLLPTWQSWAWADSVHTSYRCATWPTLRSIAYPELTCQRSPAGTPPRWWMRPGQWRTRVCIMGQRERR